MNPLLLLILAILSPMLMVVTLLTPIYGGIATACYLIYSKAGQKNPLLHNLGDISYIIDVYHGLYSQWAHHRGDISFWTYTVPLLGFPIAGLLLAFWLTRKLINRLKNLFHHNLSF